MRDSCDILSDIVEFSDSEGTIDESVPCSYTSPNSMAFTIRKIHYAQQNMRDLTYFLPNHKLLCYIGEVELDQAKQSERASFKDRTLTKLNPYIYVIHVTHGDFKWEVRRRYKDFVSLRDHVIMRVASLKLPIPTKRATMIRESFKQETLVQANEIGRRKHTLPSFPRKLEILITDSELVERKNQLETYLKGVMEYKCLRSIPEMAKFLEVSKISFVASLGVKRKEEYISKRCGGRHVFTGCLDFFNYFTYRWRKRWMVLRDTFVAYIHTSSGRIGEVLLMDRNFSVRYGLKDTGYKTGLVITNKSRRLVCCCPSHNNMMDWVNAIMATTSKSGEDFIFYNPFNSYAPPRQDSYCRWYIDGETYMNSLSNVLDTAKEEIYIAGWWLSPQLQLKRPDEDNFWELQNLLQRKAEDGVYIFILLFKEITMALNNNSYYTKKILSSLHPNIQVLRHPDHLKRRVFLWSHHEKFVVVDQKIAFVGGIDLCFGRWDTREHPIHDITKVEQRESSFPNELPLDSANSRFFKETIHMKNIFRSSESRDHTSNLISRKYPKLEEMMRNSPGNRLTSKESVNNPFSNNRLMTLMTKTFSNQSHNTNNMEETQTHLVYLNSLWKSCRHSENTSNSRIPKKFLMDNKISPTTLFVGKDYVNWIVKDCNEVDKPGDDLVDRCLVPRMPWHDVACAVYGKCARDVARHFIQRWNAVKKEKVPKNPKYSVLLPKSYVHSEIPRHIVVNYRTANCQVLRSVANWSANINETECSIMDAYVNVIRSAQHFIYIENQFFITSSTDSPNEPVKNQIALEILRRIMNAHRKKQRFRVYVMIPLLPAFEAEVGSKSAALYAELHYNYRSLFRGPASLVARLQDRGIDPWQYIFIGSLRNFGQLGSRPNTDGSGANCAREHSERFVTELIYIHDKLIIVDDVHTIIGSANLNDRSMLGNRDSEVAMYIKDEHFESCSFDGHKVLVGLFGASLRKALMKEHLGVIGDCNTKKFFDMKLLCDPVCDEFYYKVWLATANRNIAIYDEVFCCVPSDRLTSFANFTEHVPSKFLAHTDPKKAAERVKQIQGHLINYPKKFLIDEALEPSFSTQGGMMPIEMWI